MTEQELARLEAEAREYLIPSDREPETISPEESSSAAWAADQLRLVAEVRVWRKFAENWVEDKCMCEYMPAEERPCEYHKYLDSFAAQERARLLGENCQDQGGTDGPT